MELRRGWNADCVRAAVAAGPERRGVAVVFGAYSLRRLGFVLRVAALSSPGGVAALPSREPVWCMDFQRCAQSRKAKDKSLVLHERVRGCDRTRSRVYGGFVGCAVPVPPNTKPKRCAGFLMVRCWTGNGWTLNFHFQNWYQRRGCCGCLGASSSFIVSVRFSICV